MKTDGELLGEYQAGADEAFRALVERHGPMVLAACRRLAGQDAEDAVQAVFLILAKKVALLAGQRSLGPWLWRTATLVARNARRARATRAAREKEAAQMRSIEMLPPVPEATRREILAHLDAALAELPSRYRDVAVLCYLEDASQSEAAHRLGLPPSTVADRCAVALERLRARLTKRGVSLSAAALGTALAAGAAESAAAFESSAVAGLPASGGAAATSTATTLMRGAIQAMFWTKVKVAAAALAGAVLVGTGGIMAVNGLAATAPLEAEAAAPADLPQIIPDPVKADYGAQLIDLGGAVVCPECASKNLLARLKDVTDEWGAKLADRPEGKSYTAVSIKYGSKEEAAKLLEERGPQGYTLKVVKMPHGTSVEIVGGDEAGAFYAMQSLRQLAVKREGKLLIRPAEVRDWPAIKRRGLIFGYVPPAKTKDIMIPTLDLAARFKLNFLQELDLRRLTDAVKGQVALVKEFCDSHYVEQCAHLGSKDFLAKMSPDQAQKYYEERFQLGFRSFTVNFDDLTLQNAEEAEAAVKKHLEITNAIYEHLRRLDPEVRFIFCPVPYAGEPDKGLFGAKTIQAGQAYLDAVREKLPKDVPVFWTGKHVFSPAVEGEWADKFNTAIGRRLFFWDNDAIRFANARKPLSGRDPKLHARIAGHVANLNEAETRWRNDRNVEFFMITMAMYAWNPERYEPAGAARTAETIVASLFGQPLKRKLAGGIKDAKASSDDGRGNDTTCALDNDPDTCWNSGGLPPAWIEFSLDEPRTIKEISTIVGQQPGGETVHEVTATFADGSSRVVYTFKGNTKDKDVLRAQFDPPLRDVTTLRILTKQSPSWVSWNEINVK